MNKEAQDNQSSASSCISTSPSTLSDSMSPKAQPIKPPTTVSTTVTKQNKQNEETPQVSDTTNQASTSKGTTLDKHLEQQDTVLVPATKEETGIAIDALLSLGNNLNFGLEADPTDNDLLQPIAPRSTLPDPTPIVSEINSDDTEILDEHVAPDENNTPIVPTTKGTDVKQEKRKGQLVIQSFQLACTIINQNANLVVYDAHKSLQTTKN